MPTTRTPPHRLTGRGDHGPNHSSAHRARRWSPNIRNQVLAKKTIGRVRIVDEPPTEGQLGRRTATSDDLRAWDTSSS
ncbi:hypothetical protein ACFY1L_46280 [Streptomyces sp. NPDC001663]|uniref:hypothetical protein n=1 Tax=unclassified Streptomyces TaxID=2593676 RepID=UPI003325DBDF